MLPSRRPASLTTAKACCSAPLPKFVGEVATLAARVDEHLKKMGFPP